MSWKNRLEDVPTLMVLLNDREQGYLMKKAPPPIITATWVKGDHEQAAKILKDRLLQLVGCNPWLLGCIVIEDKKGYIKYPKKIDDFLHKFETEKVLKELFVHKTSPVEGFCLKTSFEAIGIDLFNHGVMLVKGKDKEQPFLNLSIIPCDQDPSARFALVLSMSHIVVDGHCYYQIYNALVKSNNTLPKLEVQRIQTTTQQQEDFIGNLEPEIFGGVGFILRMIWGVLYGIIMWPFQKKSLEIVADFFLIDAEKMKELKKQAASQEEDIEFVSTNDVVTSWFFQNCGCQHGLMFMNWRNRLEGHTDLHAGNYTKQIWYRLDDSKSPTLIRKSLKNGTRVVTSTSPPTFLELVTGDYSVVSNWSSFPDGKVSLTTDTESSFEQLLHVPVFDGGVHSMRSTISFCLIFRPTSDRLGICQVGAWGHMKGVVNPPYRSEEPFV